MHTNKLINKQINKHKILIEKISKYDFKLIQSDILIQYELKVRNICAERKHETVPGVAGIFRQIFILDDIEYWGRRKDK